MYNAQGAGALKEVLVHCPGDELDVLNPWNLKEYLFDALVYKEEAKEEHEEFIKKLKQTRVRVTHLADVIKRIRRIKSRRFLSDIITKLPNILFMRDLAVITSDGAIISNMQYAARSVEPAVIRSILEELGIKILCEIKPPGTLEGGDVLFLDKNTMLVSSGQRTNEEGIRQLKEAWFKEGRTLVKVPIGTARASMHLDTVLGIISETCVCAYLPSMGEVTNYWMQDSNPNENTLSMEEFLGARNVKVIDVTLREQFNMTCNALMVEPDKKIICYDRCFKDSLFYLEERQVELVTLYLPQLFIGGGGPHCMTLELEREEE